MTKHSLRSISGRTLGGHAFVRWPISLFANAWQGAVILCAWLSYGAAQAVAGTPQPWQMTFQPAASPIMEQIVSFHNTVLIILTAIALFVIGLIAFVILRFRASRNPIASKTSHNTLLEILWTGIPVVILAFLAYPSIKLIYDMEEAPEADITVKVIGHQWYWSYEYPEESIKFDSYMIEDKDLKPDDIRLLSVDNAVVVPVGAIVRVQVTSADVLHSWAVPSLGVKKDCVTGRLNQTWFKVNREGLYHGQCSELCGMKHGFMPIVVRAVSPEAYKAWRDDAKVKFAAAPLPRRVAAQSIFSSQNATRL